MSARAASRRPGAAARRIVVFLAIIASCSFAVFVVEYTLLTPFQVPSSSMRPALEPGQRVLVNRRVTFRQIERGDIVVFAISNDSSERPRRPGSRGSHLLVKRVVALPGERVQAKHGVVAINEKTRIPEPYLFGEDGGIDIAPVRMKRRELYVLGDNRLASKDSRSFGPVPGYSVFGVVQWRIWPLSRWKDLR